MGRREAIYLSLAKIIDKEESHNFSPYKFTPRGISKEQNFEEQGKEISVTPWEVVMRSPRSCWKL